MATVKDDEQEDDEFNQWETKALQKPEDQLELTEAVIINFLNKDTHRLYMIDVIFLFRN